MKPDNCRSIIHAMADLKKLIHDHLKSARVMQLATSVNHQPWVCTVHYYSDENMNLYWISTPARRHSQEIAKNQKVAVAIKIHEDTPSEKYIIGISAVGHATRMSKEEAEKIGSQYMSKLDKDPTLLKNILEGKNPHEFYCLKISKIVLFDTKNFSDNPRQEYNV